MLQLIIKNFVPKLLYKHFFSNVVDPPIGPLPERMKRLLCTGVGADVHFLVGQEGGEQKLFHAHKPILRIASDVFDAMFRFDGGKEKNSAKASTEVSNSGHVRVTDVDVEAFKTMLDFIYTDNLSGVNGKNAIDVLYAAKKYNLPMLAKACVEACVDIPISKLDNVFIAFAKARLLDEKGFAGRCLAYIDRNADTLIKSDKFLQIDQKLLCEILSRDQLVDTEESSIWNAAIRWANEQCRQNGLDFSAENRRQMLGPALYQIRLPIIQKEFLKEIVSSGLLTSAELVAVLLYHSTSNSSNGDAVSVPYPLPFPIRQRFTGNIMFKIGKLSEFSQANKWSRKYSEIVFIGGFQWRIYAKIVAASDIKYLGFFIECSAENNGPDWNCSCSAILRIVSQKQGKSDCASTLKNSFNSKTQNCGYPRFLSFKELMDPNNGWYMKKEDTVILNAKVTVKE